MVLLWIYRVCSNFSEDWKQVLIFSVLKVLSRLASEIPKWAIYMRQYVKSFEIHHLASCSSPIGFWDGLFSIIKEKMYQREGAIDRW